MRTNPHRGRVYRYCACRDRNGRQLGPRVARHWPLPNMVAGRSPSTCRPQHTARHCAAAASTPATMPRQHLHGCSRASRPASTSTTGKPSPHTSRHGCAKARALKPTTIARYTDYVTKDLIPALGAIRLEQLAHRDVAEFIATQLAQGRKPITLRRCVATLSSALGHSVRSRRLPQRSAVRATAPPTPARTLLLDTTAGLHLSCTTAQPSTIPSSTSSK